MEYGLCVCVYILGYELSYVIVWLAPQAGKMKRILCSVWLPKQERWAYLAHSRLPGLFLQNWHYFILLGRESSFENNMTVARD